MDVMSPWLGASGWRRGVGGGAKGTEEEPDED